MIQCITYVSTNCLCNHWHTIYTQGPLSLLQNLTNIGDRHLISDIVNAYHPAVRNHLSGGSSPDCCLFSDFNLLNMNLFEDPQHIISSTATLLGSSYVLMVTGHIISSIVTLSGSSSVLMATQVPEPNISCHVFRGVVSSKRFKNHTKEQSYTKHGNRTLLLS